MESFQKIYIYLYIYTETLTKSKFSSKLYSTVNLRILINLVLAISLVQREHGSLLISKI